LRGLPPDRLGVSTACESRIVRFLLLLLILLLIFTQAGAQASPPDPEGGAQEARRFPTEPRMASRKIPVHDPRWVCSVGEGPFLW
jgi:hypothetical protein